MGVSKIDGTLEEAVLKRVRRNLRVYERLTFRLHDGTSKSIAKAIVDKPVAERLLPGTSGRFYLYTAIDHRGVHGVRDTAGQATFAYPTANEKALLIMMPLLALWFAVSVVFLDRVPLLPAIIFIIGVPFYFLYRSTRLEARRQFDADVEYRPAGGVPLGGATAGA
ncbi:MAG: hypothetical protein M3177_04240 [Pseudomonadota bacterium]|nr:hypothetical protein [Pseudomonadota bacterium]